ncbi:hypothetical protein [Ralstonia sp. ASV6]|uniref:hypothetical protein n=1 Tax=Ralstonia sp. ASV6 TaxID=2795124 RepID=UPI0018EE3A9C|nr:hypothetical protein [Ralstonia sp. ASV6]
MEPVESDSTFEGGYVDYKGQIDRGIELLKLCQRLQSERDGVDRSEATQIDKSKINDVFAQDISTAIANMSALHKLIPQASLLAELGLKLADEGKIKVGHGDDYAAAAIRFVLAEHGLAHAGVQERTFGFLTDFAPADQPKA